MTAPRHLFLATVLLVLAGIVAYANSLSVPLLYDDLPSIFENPTITHLSQALFPPHHSGLTVSGRPLLNLSLALNYAIGGTAVIGYHLFNLTIHLAAGLLLFGIVRRTLLRPPLRERFGAASLWLAFAIALLWIVHPLQTESVTYIIQRAESLMGFFYLLTLYGLIRGAESAPKAARWYFLSVAACFLGMAVKEVMVTAPLIAFLYDRTFLAGSFREAWRQRKRFYLGLAASWLLLAVAIAGGGNRGGTAGFASGVTGGNYALTQFPALVRYLALSCWPHPLVFDYGTGVVPMAWGVVPSILLVLGLAAATGLALRFRPALGFAGAWFFLILAPTSTLLPITTETLAEHRMYLPLAAVIALAVLLLYAWIGRRLWIALPVLAIGAGSLVWLTVERNTDYQSALSIWGDTAAKIPGNARARYNFGYELLQAGRSAEAVPELEEAVRLKPDSAEMQDNLGIALCQENGIPEAIGHFKEAMRLDPNNPKPHSNLGIALAGQGRYAEAAGEFEEALRLDPNDPDARQNLDRLRILQENHFGDAPVPAAR